MWYFFRVFESQKGDLGSRSRSMIVTDWRIQFKIKCYWIRKRILVTKNCLYQCQYKAGQLYLIVKHSQEQKEKGVGEYSTGRTQLTDFSVFSTRWGSCT
jgi:hypothetical protein